MSPQADEFASERLQWARDIEAGIGYYTELNVGEDAPDFVIEAAYKALVRRYHPDSSQISDLTAAERTEKTARLNRAYETLREPELRAAYDEFIRSVVENYVRFRSAYEADARSQADAGGSGRPAPRSQLDIEPASLQLSPLTIGKTYTATLNLRNVGGPCDQPSSLLRVLPPSHPNHPSFERRHWLALSSGVPSSLSASPVAVTFDVDTSHLLPGQSYHASILVDFCGEERVVPISITTAAAVSMSPATPARRSPRTIPIIAAGVGVAAAAVLAAILITRAVSTPSSSTQGVSQAPPVQVQNRPAPQQQFSQGQVPVSGNALAQASVAPPPPVIPPTTPPTDFTGRASSTIPGTPITIPITLTSVLAKPEKPYDVYSFTLQAGQTILIQCINSVEDVGIANPNVTEFGDYETYTFIQGCGSPQTFTAVTTRTYNLGVWNNGMGSQERYTLRITYK